MCDVLIPGGVVFHNATDVALVGYPAFSFKRYYSSTLRESTPMGVGWTHNWLTSLKTSDQGIEISDGTKGRSFFTYDECDGTKAPAIARSGSAEIVLTYPDRTKRAFAQLIPDGLYHLMLLHDANGNWTALDYRDGRVEGLWDSSGRTVFLGYERNCLAEILLNHRGSNQTCRYEHDGAGHLIRAIDPNGNSEEFSYAQDLLVSHADQTAVTRYFEYDQFRRCVLNWYANGLKIRKLQFSPDNRTALLTDSYGYRELYRLDEQNRVVSMTDPIGRTKEWVYEPKGGLICEILPDGGLREAGTWVDANTLRAADLRGCETTYIYDREQNVSRIVNAIGESLKIEQDERGNLLTLTAPGKAIWRFQYDQRGALVRFTNPKGEWIERQETNGLVHARDASGSLGVFQFDPLGNLLWNENEAGRRTTYEYAAQNLLTTMLRPDGTQVRWQYDARGRITSVIDGLGRLTKYEYSPFGSVVRTVRPDGTDDRVIFDREETTRQIINSLGEKTSIDVDENFRATKITFFDGRTCTYDYDARNQVKACTDALGRLTRFSYDGANNPETIELRDGSVLQYGWDEIERLKSISFLPADRSLARPQQSTFNFTPNNYVAEEVHDDYRVQYEYDIANNLSAIKDSLGRNIRYRLGRWGAVIGIEDGGRTYELAYSATGEISELRLPNGMVQKYDYDECSRLVRRRVFAPQGKEVAWRTFEYDAADQLIGFEDWSRGRVDFRFDLCGRLTQVILNGRILEEYKFDAEGNLLSTPDYQVARVGAGNRIDQAGALQFLYDGDGYLTAFTESENRLECHYNVQDQLSKITRNGIVIAEYAYDLVGKRTHKSLEGETVRFYHHVNTLSTQISSVSGRRDFLFLPFTFVPLAEVDGDQAYFYTCDQAGVPTEVWDERGQLAATVNALAFGSRRIVQRVAGSPSVPFHFMGQYADSESGLHYNRFRYYQPAVGRFVSQDPFGLAAGLNLYSYPRNPLNRVDPLGLVGLTLQVSCVPRDPPPFTPCEQAALQTKVSLMNNNLQNQGRKARCTDCRTNEQADYFKEKCKGNVPSDWQVDHIQELQVGGADKCCANLMAIPARPNGSCGSQIYHQLKDFGGTVVGAVIKNPGCAQAHKCKSDGTKRGQDSTSCEEPNPITC